MTVTSSTSQTNPANSLNTPDLSRYMISEEECQYLSSVPNIGGVTLQFIPQCANEDGIYKEVNISCEDLSDEGVSISYNQNLSEITDLCGSIVEYPSRRYFDITATLSRGITKMNLLQMLFEAEQIEESGEYNRFKVLSKLHTPKNYFILIVRPISNPDDEILVFPRVYVRSDTVELNYSLNNPRTAQLQLRAIYANVNGERIIAEMYQKKGSSSSTGTTSTSTGNPVSSTVFTAG